MIKQIELEGSVKLLGSEKQVEWAIQIRQKKIMAMCYSLAEFLEEKSKGNSSNLKRLESLRDAVVKNLKNRKSASWWIDKRNTEIEKLYKEIAAEVVVEAAKKGIKF